MNNIAVEYRDKLRKKYKETGQTEFDFLEIGVNEKAYEELERLGICEQIYKGIIGYVVYYPEMDKQ